MYRDAILGAATGGCDGVGAANAYGDASNGFGAAVV